MTKCIPKELTNFILPFNWDVKKVWALSATVEEVELGNLEYLLELPLWSSRPDEGMLFDLRPNDVLTDLDRYPHQTERLVKADLQYPIDFIVEHGTYFILDGLHRLAKHKLINQDKIKVRVHSPDIRSQIAMN